MFSLSDCDRVLHLLALRVLLTTLRELNVSTIAGENIRHVVTLMKNTIQVLHNASYEGQNFIPHDLPEVLILWLATCTVPEFHDSFLTLHKELIREQDDTGNTPNWPSPKDILDKAHIEVK